VTPEEVAGQIEQAIEAPERGPMGEALLEAAPAFCDAIERNFAAAVDEGGMPWPAHAPLTVALYGPHPLLILSGKMLAAATEKAAPGHVERLADDGRTLEMGIDGGVIDYAWQHQRGTERIPRRQFIYVDDRGQEEIAEDLISPLTMQLFGEPGK